MVYGRLECIGTLAHLRQKFGAGFQLEFQCASRADADQLLDSLASHVREVQLLSRFRGTVRVRVRDAETDLAQLFAVAERLRGDAALGVRDYSVSHTTLEQVFLEFAKHSEEFEDEH